MQLPPLCQVLHRHCHPTPFYPYITLVKAIMKNFSTKRQKIFWLVSTTQPINCFKQWRVIDQTQSKRSVNISQHQWVFQLFPRISNNLVTGENRLKAHWSHHGTGWFQTDRKPQESTGTNNHVAFQTYSLRTTIILFCDHQIYTRRSINTLTNNNFQSTWRLWGEEKVEGAVFSVYLKKVTRNIYINELLCFCI